MLPLGPHPSQALISHPSFEVGKGLVEIIVLSGAGSVSQHLRENGRDGQGGLPFKAVPFFYFVPPQEKLVDAKKTCQKCTDVN